MSEKQFRSVNPYITLTNLKKKYIIKRLTEWTHKHTDALNSISVVYADISPNVVDGSSVWLSSLINILSGFGPVTAVLKENPRSDIILSNINPEHSVYFISPSDFGLHDGAFPIQTASDIVRILDGILPNVQRVFVRGIYATEALAGTRQFKGRLTAYLTNFYEIDETGRHIPEDRANKLKGLSKQVDTFLFQTQRIQTAINQIAGTSVQGVLLPPVLADCQYNSEEFDLPAEARDGSSINIGYAGKINPAWGFTELLDWVEQAKRNGHNINLYVACNKISDSGGGRVVEGFKSGIEKRLNKLGAYHYRSFNRAQSTAMLKAMDLVWAYRPPWFENATLELSTKLLEGVACNGKCICYPSNINKEALGSGYPCFVSGYDEFEQLLYQAPNIEIDDALMRKIASEHSVRQAQSRLGDLFCDSGNDHEPLIFAGHDFKFIDSYISRRKAAGLPAKRDYWEWGSHDSNVPYPHRERSEVFCEWGLANAVHYSRAFAGQHRLIVRIHSQEIDVRARKFGEALDATGVRQFIFVSENVREEAIRLFGWPEEKTTLIPNFLEIDEYTYQDEAKALPSENVTLGMVGIIPQRKRFDRAVSLLRLLNQSGINARLKIKGPRPETVEFMRGEGRREELAFYFRLYDLIAQDDLLRDKVIFEGWGNDVAIWYEDVDFILSPSDFESFHYALADGVLSGCWPIVWPWEGMERIYPEAWKVTGDLAAVAAIQRILSLSADEARMERAQNRQYLVDRYGFPAIFPRLDAIV